MPIRDNVRALPLIASTTIDELLQEFICDEALRLSPATLKKYQQITNYFELCLNEYGHLYLGRAELRLYERLSSDEGNNHREYCQIFGAEKILENVVEFLGYFLMHRVDCSKEILRQGATVVKRISRWMEEKDYISKEDGQELYGIGTTAARLLPRAHDLAHLLANYACDNAPHLWETEMEDMFIIDRIDEGMIYLSGLNINGEAIGVPVDQKISSKLEQGWQVSLMLGKTSQGWQIVKVGNVYPL